MREQSELTKPCTSKNWIKNQNQHFKNLFNQRFHARSDFVDRTRFALDNSVKFVMELEKYTNYEYELNYMFSAAIPDFQSRELVKLY